MLVRINNRRYSIDIGWFYEGVVGSFYKEVLRG